LPYMVALQQQKQLQPPTTTKGAMIPLFFLCCYFQSIQVYCISPCNNEATLAPLFFFFFFFIMGANWQGNFTPYHCLMCLNLVAMGEAWATPPFFKCVFVSKKNRRKRCHHNVSKQRSFAPHHWWAPPPLVFMCACL
jgi:hypothetical protein